jgi:hypothetical protein
MAEPQKPTDPGKGARAPDLGVHPLVARLNPDPDSPRDLAVVVGYIGPSKDRETVRIYTDLSFRSYVEAPREAVASTEPTDREDPDSPTRVYLEASAKVNVVQSSSQSVEASYLQGSIASQYLGGAAVPGTTAQLTPALAGTFATVCHISQLILCQTQQFLCHTHATVCCPRSHLVVCPSVQVICLTRHVICELQTAACPKFTPGCPGPDTAGCPFEPGVGGVEVARMAAGAAIPAPPQTGFVCPSHLQICPTVLFRCPPPTIQIHACVTPHCTIPFHGCPPPPTIPQYGCPPPTAPTLCPGLTHCICPTQQVICGLRTIQHCPHTSPIQCVFTVPAACGVTQNPVCHHTLPGCPVVTQAGCPPPQTLACDPGGGGPIGPFG